jgi:hypothetical protein
MVVKAALVTPGFVTAEAATAGLVTAEAATAAVGAGAPGVFVVTVTFSFGFRAAFAALLYSFIFSTFAFIRRRAWRPPRFPASRLRSILLLPDVGPALVDFMAPPFQSGKKQPCLRPELPPPLNRPVAAKSSQTGPNC